MTEEVPGIPPKIETQITTDAVRAAAESPVASDLPPVENLIVQTDDGRTVSWGTLTPDAAAPLAGEDVSGKPIVMGCRVKDLTMKFRGFVVGRVDHLNGCTQFTVQTEGTNESSSYGDAKAWSIDEQSLEYVDEGISARIRLTRSSDTIQLGDEVEDQITGYTGIAVNRETSMNGCAFYQVVPRTNKDKKAKKKAKAKAKEENLFDDTPDFPRGERIMAERLVVKSSGIRKHVEKVQAATTVPASSPADSSQYTIRRPPGGPATRYESPY